MKSWKKGAIFVGCFIAILIVIATLNFMVKNRYRDSVGVSSGDNLKSNSGSVVENLETVQNATYFSEETGESGTENGDASGEENTNTVSTEKWDLTKVNIVYDTNNVPVPVPKGYVASGADGEHTVNTGFVIYEGDGEVTTENAWDESLNRNQWVWIPVPDPSRVYSVDANGRKSGKIYDYSSTGRTNSTSNLSEPGFLTSSDNYDSEKFFIRNNLIGMTKDKFYQELQREYDSTIESIIKYGGFYVGRYETGNLSSKVPVVNRMNEDIDRQTWYRNYSQMKYLAANNNVKTNIIWGSLFYETLQWLVDTGCKNYENMTDSVSWGNYKESTFEYTTTTGNILTKLKSESVKIATGSTEYTNANNIYDIAGNGVEMTLLASSNDRRVGLGAAYGSPGGDARVVYKDYIRPDSINQNLSYAYDYYGVRAYLYIK